MLTKLYAWLADRSLMAKGLWVVLIPLAPLVLTSALIYVVQGYQRDAATTVVRSRNVENELYILLGLLEEAEAGQRAYLLTGDESWLQSVRAAHQGMPATLQRLEGSITDTAQRGHLARMPTLIARRLAALDAVVDEARTRGQFSALVPPSYLEPGRQVMTAVRAETTSMLGRQAELLAVRRARAERMGQILLAVAGAGAALGVAGGVLAVMIFTVGISSRINVLNGSLDRLVRGAPLPAPLGGRDEIGVLGSRLHQAAELLVVRDRELRRAHEELDRFFTLSLDVFAIAGMDGYFKQVNPSFSQTLGYSMDELMTRPFFDLVHPDDRVATLAEVEKLSRGLPTITFENRCQRKDGSWRWLSWKAQPLVEEGVIHCTGRDITARKEGEAAITKLNADLQQRSVALAEANKELEAFSYSVSHDLRAPLRSIDGFSQILLEDCAEQLNDEGKDALQRVRKAATAMGELIDALLALSRLSRVDLRFERVDLSALGHVIAAELRQAQPDRQAEVLIAPGLVVEADPRLLRAVLANLLGNAWKYTQPRARARIEFGCLDKEGESAYFVRDNGVGFDMAYVDNLFGAFQRLHAQTEFVGAGIGLATVQRIIHRHGGRVWAEGAVDQGAGFYFTLHSPAGSTIAAGERAETSVMVSRDRTQTL